MYFMRFAKPKFEEGSVEVISDWVKLKI